MSERFVTPAPLPTPREREILIILMEECAEVQQRASKALRFGLADIEQGQSLRNRTRLAQEIGDLRSIVFLAQGEGIIDADVVSQATYAKDRKLEIYMQTDPEDGSDGPGK